MKNKSFLICFFLFVYAAEASGQSIPPEDRICGKWESAAKNLRILIYLEGDQFKAKLIWFSDTDGKPMDYWTDVNNPDPKLRNRKLLGMSILSGLTYDAGTNSWEKGMVYDSRRGR